MSIMNSFEGVKKIKNNKELTIEFLYNLLNKYKVEIGKVTLSDENKIIADVDGKYIIEIYIIDDFIKIERIIESNKTEKEIEFGSDLKSIDMAKADRMVEQIYDLINSIDENGNVKEYITGVKKVLFVKQEEGTLRNHFYFTNNSGGKEYEIKENKILKEFSAMNSKSRMQEFTIQYREMELGKYTIIKTPYTLINVDKKTDEIKTTFIGKINNKNVKIVADYSENHYLIEVDDIVRGAIDSLTTDKRDSYRLEINDLDYEYLIIALTVIIDMNYNN